MTSSNSNRSAGSRWRKAKTVLGRNMCASIPRTRDDGPLPPPPTTTRRQPSPSASATPPAATTAPAAASRRLEHHSFVSPPARSRSTTSSDSTPALSSSPRRPSKCNSKSSSKNTCAICLGSTKPGHGQALFTAECSHIFHFHCIASNVRHGNQLCPVCRAKWNDLPFQAPSAVAMLPQPLPPPHGRPSRVNPLNMFNEDAPYVAFLSGLPRPQSASARQGRPAEMIASEPNLFDDDEPLAPEPPPAAADGGNGTARTTVECNAYTQVSAVQRCVSREDFNVLLHIKAPVTGSVNNTSAAAATSPAPVDLVTVLDVSGSMAGTKLALLKRAMAFVIRNLAPSDRLSVVTFSSTARRLFPLRCMSEQGKLHAIQAVYGLTSHGGTNIAEGLSKAAKVMGDRRGKNPVCGIILLSDGQDTFTAASTVGANTGASSILPAGGLSAHPIPVHAFGFGADHDATALHSISESSGGTFSFVETESVIQDAFAQCIGGLLSVVVQDLHVKVQSTHPAVRIGTINSGNYAVHVRDDKLQGVIEVGDLYADEERDFLVSVTVPPCLDNSDSPDITTDLLTLECTYKDPVSKDFITYCLPEPVKIQRPEICVDQSVSIEVDRQRNRLHAASAMASARAAAERGSLLDAVSVLETCRQMLVQSPSARAGDRLCTALDAELKEMQDRMATQQRYEESGRAYMLSGLSSHLWQRATARGDSTDSTSLVGAYQTPSMTEMLHRSQTLVTVPETPGNRSCSSSRTLSKEALAPRWIRK